MYPLHRVLMENKIGRLLESHEHVHHRNGDKEDNSIGNLELLTVSEHAKRHAETVEKIQLKCPVCQTSFEVMPHRYRLRMKRSKSGALYCSRSCGAKANRRERKRSGMEQWSVRMAHNHEVGGSTPPPAIGEVGKCLRGRRVKARRYCWRDPRIRPVRPLCE